ncbi:MAG: twin-arginine translocase TatA/TatE family subunit [Candidatus Electrothrix sp. ATG2]|nr:twin-arginine translocase TatA/TatE family subunit [Candidatus Electrothrix sp. ATG2]
MIVILAVALIVVGPDKLPELARSLAKGVNELKNTMNQVKESLSEETEIVSSVQKDLQQTAGQMKTNLLEDVTRNPNQWKQEGEAASASDDNAEDDDVIEVDSSIPRSWEEESEPVVQEESEPEPSERAENDLNKVEEQHEVEGDTDTVAQRSSSAV